MIRLGNPKTAAHVAVRPSVLVIVKYNNNEIYKFLNMIDDQ